MALGVCVIEDNNARPNSSSNRQRFTCSSFRSVKVLWVLRISDMDHRSIDVELAVNDQPLNQTVIVGKARVNEQCKTNDFWKRKAIMC